MQRIAYRALSALFLVVGLAGVVLTSSSASAEPAGALSDLPCAHDVWVQAMTKSMPEGANGQALVSARITIEPGGGYDPHTHPGTLNVYVDSGQFTFTLMEDHEMMVNRAATGSAEVMTPNAPTVLNPGDFLTETGMVHQAWNLGDEPVVVILSGLVDPDAPLTQCVDASATSGHHS